MTGEHPGLVPVPAGALLIEDAEGAIDRMGVRLRKRGCWIRRSEIEGLLGDAVGEGET